MQEPSLPGNCKKPETLIVYFQKRSLVQSVIRLVTGHSMLNNNRIWKICLIFSFFACWGKTSFTSFSTAPPSLVSHLNLMPRSRYLTPDKAQKRTKNLDVICVHPDLILCKKTRRMKTCMPCQHHSCPCHWQNWLQQAPKPQFAQPCIRVSLNQSCSRVDTGHTLAHSI